MNRRKFLFSLGTGTLGLLSASAVTPQIVEKLTGKEQMKKILVITGSPRRRGNSDLLADAFIKGAKEAGHEIVKYETAFKHLNPCQACDNCFKTDELACIFNDDFNELAQEMIKCDVIVFVTPLYWSSYPSNLKNSIDKFYSFYIGKRLNLLENKRVYLLAVGEDKNRSGFEIIQRTHKGILDYHKWIDAGQIIVPGVKNKGDIKQTDALLEAQTLGRRA